MIALFTTLVRLFLQAFRSKRNILTENPWLKKENEILARKTEKKRVHSDFYEKLFLVVLHRAADIAVNIELKSPSSPARNAKRCLCGPFSYGGGTYITSRATPERVTECGIVKTPLACSMPAPRTRVLPPE
jgi:hypothetical protein